MKKCVTGLLLLAFAVPSFAEDEEPLVLHCVYESSAGIFNGLLRTSTHGDNGQSVPIRDKETLKITGEQIEHAYNIPTPIVNRTDDYIVGRYYSTEYLLLQNTYVFERQDDHSYSVLFSVVREKISYIDYGTCTKF